jgi:hypothetical protein
MPESIQAGTVYRHYKGNLYRVLMVARHSETCEQLIIYQGLYTCPTFGDQPIWARPISEFLEEALGTYDMKANKFFILEALLILSSSYQSFCVPRNALHRAISEGNYDRAKVLLQMHKINPNILDDEGETPLHCALYHSDARIITLLMDCGADPYLKNNDNKTPWELAGEIKDQDLIEALSGQAHF